MIFFTLVIAVAALVLAWMNQVESADISARIVELRLEIAALKRDIAAIKDGGSTRVIDKA